MRKRIGRFAIILSAVIWATAAMSACRKKEEPKEIDRTFDFTQDTSRPVQTETQTESQSSTEETTEKTTQETTTKKPAETTTEETKLEGAAAYFGDKKSVFNTLPAFEGGKFEEHFDYQYVEGMRFSDTKESDYTEYLQSVLNAGKYTLNSQDGTRAYLERTDGKMRVTLIYKDGTFLIEAGESYWDILTLADEKKEEPTKPSETTDSRYGYFDNKELVFSQLPYFTEGSFTGYEAVEGGGIMSFSDITEETYENYSELLQSNGFMFTGSLPDGQVSYFTNDSVVVTATYSSGSLKLQVIKQR
ncbi:MAG: hypothetical protein ACI4R6_05665 [Lachnospiraceae bacterium]